jgi:hypothetical protein
MFISIRKRTETKQISKTYLNHKTIKQIGKLKNLAIIDKKFHFSDHVSYLAEKSIKLIYSLVK